MRVAYDSEAFDESALAATWTEQLQSWLNHAIEADFAEPNAMVLATANSGGRPSSRTVLCKGLDERGVVFYTNYTSAKSHDLTAARYASATFPWYLPHRRVTVRAKRRRSTPRRRPNTGRRGSSRVAARWTTNFGANRPPGSIETRYWGWATRLVRSPNSYRVSNSVGGR
jgi:pyridoxine/pyridoxamine 5'-phosphate oxidase